MSKRSGRQLPRLRRGMIIFLLIVGSGIFVTLISMITYSQLEGSGSPIAIRLISSKDSLYDFIGKFNQGRDGKLIIVDAESLQIQAEEILGESEEKTEEESAGVEKKIYLEDQIFETALEFEQNDVYIRAIQFEMIDEFLIVRFEIDNDSSSTLYFPYHGTYASYTDNGGTMYRDSDRESGVGYDQITSVIEPGERIIGKISYSPLLYRDKPFTIYINSMKFREKDADWKSFEFFFDPVERSTEKL